MASRIAKRVPGHDSRTRHAPDPAGELTQRRMRRETGMRKQVSTMEQHQEIEQVLPREESTPGKPNPCAARSDSRSEA